MGVMGIDRLYIITMTTPFKAKAEGVLVEVPEGAMHMSITGNLFWYVSDKQRRVELPPGDWQLVGTSDTMSEDDWKGIVQSSVMKESKGESTWYRDYKEDLIEVCGKMVMNSVYPKAKQSGHSLLPDPSKRYAVILKKTK